LLLAVQPIGRLVSGVDDALTKLLQLIENLRPVVLELLKDVLQCLRKGGLEVGIIIELNVEVVADSVLDLGGFGLRPGSPFYLLLKVLVED
jgi:hypothetical protein